MDIKYALIKVIASLKKNTKGSECRVRLRIEARGARTFSHTGKYTVPLRGDPEPYYYHQMLVPPSLDDQQVKMLAQAGIKRPRIGWVKNEYFLHLNDEDQYLFAKMLL